MNTKKQKHKVTFWIKKITKLILWFLLIIVIVGTISFVAFNSYLLKQERKIFNDISFLNNGDIAFDRVYFSWFKDFPYLSLVVDNVELTDTDLGNHEIPILKNTTIEARISVKNWRDRTIEIKHFTLEGGSFYFFKDSLRNSNIMNLLKQNDTQSANKYGITVNTEHFNVALKNMNTVFVDSSKMRFLDGVLKNVEAEIFNDGLVQSCKVSMDVDVGQLIFNRRSGIFLENALVSGDFNATVKDNYVFIETFPITINSDILLFGANISIDKNLKSTLNIENKNTDLQSILPLLPNRIRTLIEPFKVKDRFYSKALIEIVHGTEPFADVRFNMNGNDVIALNQSLQSASLEGQFVNRKDNININTDVEKGDYYLEFLQVSALHNKFNINTPKVVVKGAKYTEPQITTNATIHGKAANVSRWYQSDKFFFEQGDFKLNIALDGEVNDISQLFIESDATLYLNDLEVFYKPAEVSIPIDSMYLFKNSGDATFSVVSTTLEHNYNYKLDGGLENLAALINSTVGESSQSTAIIIADRLGWKDFVGLFSIQKGDITTAKGELETKKSMKETINGIYEKFEPSLTIRIDTFDYFDKIQLYNLETGAFFNKEKFFVLDSTKFDLEQGNVEIKARLDIGEPDQTAFVIDLSAENLDLAAILKSLDYFNIPLLVELKSFAKNLYVDIHLEGVVKDDGGLVPHKTRGEITFRDKLKDKLNGNIDFVSVNDELNTSIILNGNPVLFNTFFETEEFFFQNAGQFETKVSYQGDVGTISELFDEATIDFSISKGEVYYDNVDIVFPLERFDVFLERDTVDFNLHMKSDILERTLRIDGAANNVSELLFGNTGKKLSTSINVESPFLKLDDAIFIFQSSPDSNEVQITDAKIKVLIGSLLNRFNPRVQIQLDSFIVNKEVKISDLITGMHLQDSTNVILEQTNFNFCDGEIGLNLNWDISEPKIDPISGNLSTTELSLGQLLEKLDYLDIPSLENATNIEGEINLDLNFEGKLEDLKLLEGDTKAQLDFKIENLKVAGIDIVDDITKKLRISRFFQKIRFAPISNSVTLEGSYIEVPQMEIQSNIGNVFIEGFIDKNEKTNLWLSIPINNLWNFRHNRDPKKKGYAESNAKIFLEIFAVKNGEIETKFHITKKKFYIQRNKLDEFKEDKKKNRTIRRNLRIMNKEKN